MANSLVLKNKDQSVTFVPEGDGYRPEWFRLGNRPMLRFKDHDFTNVSAIDVKVGRLLEQSDDALKFGGEVEFGGVRVGWTVRIAKPADGGSGFTVTSNLIPLQEPIEVLEGLSTFELPYEYDGTEKQMTVMSQQPVYRFEGSEEVTGAGYNHPFWYYGRAGRVHLTYPSAAPLMINRVENKDGSNARCTTIIGNWNVCSVKDMFAQPTRNMKENDADMPFDDPELDQAPGKRGMKFLVGAANWNTSLHKDPNFLVDLGEGLSQEVTVDFSEDFPGGRWDTWLAGGWERMVKVHLPADGHVPAWEVARSRGASWTEAAKWLAEQFQKPEGNPGFFYPNRGPCVYAPFTRPGWDGGVKAFAGQWVGPLSYLGHVYNDSKTVDSTVRLEKLFNEDEAHGPEQVGTIGPTPQYTAMMRKGHLMGLSDDSMHKVEDWIRRHTLYVLDPPPGAKRGDGGILAWDAFANLLAADLFDKDAHEKSAKELLERVNKMVEERFESFNCAAIGDMVGAGQGRPFGHGIAMTANTIAYRRWGNAEYLEKAQLFGNIMMGLYYSTCNNSPVPDMDTRGWAAGSNGGRDQYCDLPPWETAYALQQFAYLIEEGKGREGMYDLLWLFAHTGLCMFPKARTMKRLYRPDFSIEYRQIDSIASEREFYLKYPYLAYEEPWDQTMLAGYQGVEPLILSLYLGGGLVAPEDDRVMTLVPQAATYDAGINKKFTVHLWNPLADPIQTRLIVPIAAKRGETWKCSAVSGAIEAEHPVTAPVDVPPRMVTRIEFSVAE